MILSQSHSCRNLMMMLIRRFFPSVGTSNLYRALHKDSSGLFPFSKPLQTAGTFTGKRRASGCKNSADCINRRFICRATTMQEEVDPITMEEGLRRKCHRDLMIVSDLDFTMVDHEDPSNESLLNFNCLWAAEYARNSILVYSTGRSVEKYIDLRQRVPLLTPAIVVLSVGTEIFYGQSLKPDLAWQKILDEGWDRDIVLEEAGRFPQLRLQEDSEQRPHKVSFYLDKQDAPNVQHELLSRLQQRGIEVKLIYSGGMALDALPKMGGKGEALTYILSKMKNEGWQSKNVLVCGDSGNDTELFLVEGVNGVIGNGATMVYPWGRETNLKESLDLVRQKHGLMIGKGFMTWIDNIEERQLAEGVYLVTWQSWEKFEGGVHKGYYATAILLSKDETPNGVQWLRVHETPRKIE